MDPTKYQEDSVLLVIQHILTNSPPFLAHEARLFEWRTPMTPNQTHIGKLQLDDVDLENTQDESEEIQGFDS